MKKMLLLVALMIGMGSSGFAMQMMDWNWIQQRANNGDVDAIMTLAHATNNPSEAMRWYDLAAQKGSGEAAYWMGMQFLPGGSRENDRAVAVSWLTKAADEGYEPARQELYQLNPASIPHINQGGGIPVIGEGIPNINQGGIPVIGEGIPNIGGGVPNIGGRDPMQHLMRMAERGDVEAMFRLGQKLFNGGAGSGHDERAAFMWFQKAANAGYTPAMHQLAQMFGRGIGVRQDINKARYWDMQADRHGRY